MSQSGNCDVCLRLIVWEIILTFGCVGFVYSNACLNNVGSTWWNVIFTGTRATHSSDKRSFSLIFTLFCQHLWHRSNLCHVYSKPLGHIFWSCLLLGSSSVYHKQTTAAVCFTVLENFFPRKVHINVDIVLSNLYSGYIFWETGNRVLKLRCI